MMPPNPPKKVYVHDLILRICEYYLIWQKIKFRLLTAEAYPDGLYIQSDVSL